MEQELRTVNYQHVLDAREKDKNQELYNKVQ